MLRLTDQNTLGRLADYWFANISQDASHPVIYQNYIYIYIYIRSCPAVFLLRSALPALLKPKSTLILLLGILFLCEGL